MDKLFIMWHMGLGDSLICNGLVRTKALEYDKVFLPCYEHNLPSVSFMFSDLLNVTFQPCGDEIRKAEYDHNCAGHEILRLGMYSQEPHIEPETFDQTFYRQADVEFSKRWDGFKIPDCECFINPHDGRYAFICESVERGYVIDGSRIDKDLTKARMWNAPTIFKLMNHISDATELHCINSAPAVLADSILTKGKLFLHRYARPHTPYDNFKVRKDWTILD